MVGGAIATLLAPYVTWQIEKERIRLETRRKLIADARAFLQTPHEKREIADSDVYARLRPSLYRTIIESLESDSIEVHIGGTRGAGVNNYSSKLLDEVVRLEKEWHLI